MQVRRGGSHRVVPGAALRLRHRVRASYLATLFGKHPRLGLGGGADVSDGLAAAQLAIPALHLRRPQRPYVVWMVVSTRLVGSELQVFFLFSFRFSRRSILTSRL